MITPEENVDYENEQLERRTHHRRYENGDEANGNGNGDRKWLMSLPAWARAVVFLGTSATIALFLVYQTATWLPKVVDQLVTLNTTVSLGFQRQEEMLSRVLSETEKTHRDAQLTCRMAAKTIDAASQCP